MHRKHILAASLVTVALASVAVYAQRAKFDQEAAIRGVSADIKARPEQVRLSQRAGKAAPAAAKGAPFVTMPTYSVTVDDVYDTDSFGRFVKYLGLTSAFINLDPACPPPSSPDEFCQTLSATPGAITPFNFPDAARIKLPKSATHSLLCYWFSPVLTVNYTNPTASRVYGRLRYNPTLTIENPVLADPALIDPTTGAPFGGQLLTSMTSSEIFTEVLEPGVNFTERTRDSTVCMAGFISRRALIDNYGLTDAQADAFFASETTVRLNISGSAQNVGFASMVFGLRVMGD
jgi:hypothetical protein